MGVLVALTTKGARAKKIMLCVQWALGLGFSKSFYSALFLPSCNVPRLLVPFRNEERTSRKPFDKSVPCASIIGVESLLRC